MNLSLTEQMVSLGKEINKRKERRAELKGRMKAILEDLEKTFNVASIQVAKDLLVTMREDERVLRKRLSKEIESIAASLKESEHDD